MPPSAWVSAARPSPSRRPVPKQATVANADRWDYADEMNGVKLMRATLRRHALAFVLTLAICASARAEAVQFHAAPVNPTPLRQRLAQQRGVPALPLPGNLIGGELYRPPGSGPFPAIVALHGCAGWSQPQFERQTMQRYVSLGYVVLDVYSFGLRGIGQACLSTDVQADRIGDAFGALDWLASQPFVDGGRVAVLGFAQGAGVALFVVSQNGAAQGCRAHFRAAVAYYPACSPSYAHLTAPALVLVGTGTIGPPRLTAAP
jgi:dienelactone hydrolase